MRKATVEFDMEVSKPKSLGLRLAAYLCSALALFNPVAPALANILEDVTIEQDLNENPLYLKATGGDYQFNAPQFIEWPSSGTKSLESVYQELLRDHSSAISPPTYVPIGVGGITTFIPTYTRYKYVGTPAVQARYVRTQIVSLLGRNIFKYASEAEQLNALYSNAVSYAKDHGVRYGVPLFLDQNSSGLERDMIWPELRDINGQAVIVPVVYLTANTVSEYKVVDTDQQIPKAARFGSLTVYNSNLKTERDTFLEIAKNLKVFNGSITGDGALKILALGKFDNASSIVSANGDLEIGAKSIDNRTIVYRYDLGHEQGTRYGEIASIASTNGDVILKSHSDIQFNGADASAQNGSLILEANGNILIGTQQLYSGSTSRYGNGTQTRSQVSYLQSHLTAEDTLALVANGQIVIEAAELASDSGHIALLGTMGVSVLDAEGVTQFQASGKFGKTNVNESAYLTVAMRAVLDAGKGITIHSDVGNITLRATEISSVDGTSISATNGQVNLLVSTLHDEYNYQSVRKGSLTVKTRNRGHNITTGIPNTIVGGLSVEAVAGLNIQYTSDGNKTFEEQLSNFEKMPELKWITDLKNRTDLDINWSEIEQQYETWNKSNTSLSPAAIAIIAIVVTVATGGAAAALGQTAAGALTGTAATTVSAAVTAGVTAMATQVAVITANSFVNGEYNPYEIQKDIHTEETLATVATAMVTAAALSYLDTAFFEDVDVDALAKQQGVDPSTIDAGWLRDAQGQLNFVGQAAQATTNAAASSFIEVLAQGGSLSDFGGDFHNTFERTLKRSVIDSLGEETYQGIAGAQFNTAVEYIALVGAGCVFGAAVGEGSDDRSDCYSGAGGAVIGKYLGDKASEDAATPEQLQEMQQQQKEWLSENGVMSVEDWRQLQISDPDAYLKLVNGFNRQRLSTVRDLQRGGVDVAKLTAGLLAFALGGEVDVAADQAAVSIANNTKLAQKFGVLDAINVLADYERLKPLLELQEQLATADIDDAVEIIGAFARRYSEYSGLADLPIDKALAAILDVVRTAGYDEEFDLLARLRFQTLFSVSSGEDVFAEEIDSLIETASGSKGDDSSSYWELRQAANDPDAMSIIVDSIDSHFAARFGVSNCGSVGACVEASTLFKALILSSNTEDLISEAQAFYTQSRPRVLALGDPELLRAFDTTFAYYSAASEVLIEMGGGTTQTIEATGSALLILIGMADYAITGREEAKLEYSYGLEVTLGVLETTQYLAENLEQLPEGAQSAWDSYQDRIDVAEAEGNVLLAEKLKAKRVYYFSSVLLPVTRASGDIIQEIKLLPAPRKVEASWGASEYRHGGLMTGIEHIMYRHSFDSGFSGVSRFSDGTSIRDVSYYVDSALRYGTVTDKGNGEFKIQYDFKYVIGYSKAGDPTSRIEMYVRDGIIQTAYPL